MVIALTLNPTKSDIKIENLPNFSFGEEVKLLKYGQDSHNYKVFAIAISSLSQDEEYGFWEARYIYALHDADSKPSTVNVRWEYEYDLVPSDFWTRETEF
jgi:hypothetical protein